jgi:Zn-finger nucleic acid-binding protein
MPPQKPSQAEEEYFAREDAEKKRKLALTVTKSMAQAERDALQALHQNHCPGCGQKLHDIALNGVTAARCFGCQGIFLNESALTALAAEPGYWSRMLQFFVQHDYSKTP